VHLHGDVYEGTFGNKIVKKLLHYVIMGDMNLSKNSDVLQLVGRVTCGIRKCFARTGLNMLAGPVQIFR